MNIEPFLFVSLILLIVYGCMQEDIRSAEKMFMNGSYSKCILMCNKLLFKNPKPEFQDKLKTMLKECNAGIDYQSAINQLQQDKRNGYFQTKAYRDKHQSTSFSTRFDSLVNATYTFLVGHDQEFSLRNKLVWLIIEASEKRKTEGGAGSHRIHKVRFFLSGDGKACKEMFTSNIDWLEPELVQ